MTPVQRHAIHACAQALQSIKAGSDHTGRWLDESGTECEEDDPNARWEEFTDEEQAQWLDTVASDAERALTELQAAFPRIAKVAS